MEKSKSISDFVVKENERLSDNFSLLKLIPKGGVTLPNVYPGQFVQVKVPNSEHTFLRRPISICNFIAEEGEIWLLVRKAGEGTAVLCDMKVGDELNLIVPLGNGFKINEAGDKVVLAGGGVGVAPLLYLGKKLKEAGKEVNFLIGTRGKKDLMLLDEFSKYGKVYISTEDGSAGEKGLITTNTVLNNNNDKLYCCGPLPMMKALAGLCREKGMDCEVSLENVMGCGIGACLCCVEKTVKGNQCVCTDGPVFNINQLTW